MHRFFSFLITRMLGIQLTIIMTANTSMIANFTINPSALGSFCVLMHCDAVQLRTLFPNLSLTSLRSAWGRPPPQCTPLSSLVGEEPDCMTADASDRRALSQGRGDERSFPLHTRQRASGGARSSDPMESKMSEIVHHHTHTHSSPS